MWTYKDVIYHALDLHVGRDSVDDTDIARYYRYAKEVVKDIYYLLAPVAEWAVKSFIWQGGFVDYVSYQAAGDFFPNPILRIKKVTSLDGKQTLTKLSGAQFTTAQITQDRGFYYTEAEGLNNIAVYTKPILSQKIVVYYVPDLSEDKPDINQTAFVTDVEARLDVSNANRNFNEQKGQITDKIPLPEKYRKMVLDGVLTQLYQETPTVNASAKESLVFERFDTAKRRAFVSELNKSKVLGW